MISVQLKAQTNVDTTTLSSYAAKVCYTSAPPELGQLIQVKERLFDPGHHTTIEHNHFTFLLDGVSVSSIMLGMHLNAPYYNSDQRSGRFSKMYDNPDMNEIRSYLADIYPNEDIDSAVAFIQKGVQIYQENIVPLTELAIQAIREERPFAGDKYIEQNAKKFAQEQLRVFISQVMPTALVMTINVSALAALWRVAWSPEMRRITDGMRDEVLQVQPDLAYMFDEAKRQNIDWSPAMEFTDIRVCDQPVCTLLDARIEGKNTPMVKDSVDLLPFSPISMDNNLSLVRTEVMVSCATMGEDQRHRSIHRGIPTATGAFYLPPLLKRAGLAEQALSYMKAYANLATKLSPALMATIMPYGVMMKYQKVATLNALLHEQGKRLCWCAQEEIYDIARQLRMQLSKLHPDIADRLAPPCYRGQCREGVRYCGRQIKQTEISDYFPRRQV